MPVEPRHLDLALAVKRGQCRLRELPEAERPFVHAVLQRTTDAQLATLALSKERRATTAKTGVPRRVFSPKHSLSRA